MCTMLQNKEGSKSGLISSGQIYEKTQRYATYLMGLFSQGLAQFDTLPNSCWYTYDTAILYDA